MSYRLLQLPDMLISDLEFQKDQYTLIFSDASIIKVMDAARQRTSWRQSGRIVVKGDFDDGVDASKIEFPKKVQGGEFQDNVFVYHDTIRLPCRVSGDVGLSLIFEQLDQPFIINGEKLEVVLTDTPKYVAHVD